MHEIDHSPLMPNPALGAAIEQLPGRKLILTNGTRKHAEAVMQRLDIDQHFEDVFDIAAADLDPKPLPQVYRPLPRASTASIPTKAAMFEDLARNLGVPHALGMTTVLVVPPDDARGLPRGLGAGRPRCRACRPRHRRSGGLPAGEIDDRDLRRRA